MLFQTPILSDGTSSTLGRWREIAALLTGEDSPATKYFEDKIEQQGEDEPVLAHESQVLNLILSMGGSFEKPEES